MSIFDKFKKKPMAPLSGPDENLDMDVDLPPPPPIKNSMEIPSFPKFSTEAEYVPELPKLSSDPSLNKGEIDIPLPPQAEIIKEPVIEETKFPDISPFGMEPFIQEKPEVSEDENSLSSDKPKLDFEPIIKQQIKKKNVVESELSIIDYTQKEIPEEFSPIQHLRESEEKEIYIEMEEYQKVLAEISNIRKSLNGLNIATTSIKELKDKETTAYNSWQKLLDEMKKKFLFIDHSLFNEV